LLSIITAKSSTNGQKIPVIFVCRMLLLLLLPFLFTGLFSVILMSRWIFQAICLSFKFSSFLTTYSVEALKETFVKRIYYTYNSFSHKISIFYINIMLLCGMVYFVILILILICMVVPHGCTVCKKLLTVKHTVRTSESVISFYYKTNGYVLGTSRSRGLICDHFTVTE